MGGEASNTKIGTQRYGVLLCTEASKPLKYSIRAEEAWRMEEKKGQKNRDAGFYV